MIDIKKQTLIVSAFVLTIAGGLVLGVTQVSAQSDVPMQQSLVQKIADKFKLNTADVQAVFDEEKKTHIAQMQAKLEDRLTQAVNDGKITDAQKTLIINKLKELQSQRQANMDKLKTMTPEQRKAEMDAQRTSLEEWAQQNGIDMQYMFGFHGKGMRSGMWNNK